MHWDKLLTIFLFGLFLVSFASALELDNRITDYNISTKEVIIKNALGLGKELVRANLQTAQTERVIDRGDGVYQKVAEIKYSYLDEDVSKYINSIEFTNNFNSNTIQRDYKLKYRNQTSSITKPIYTNDCNTLINNDGSSYQVCTSAGTSEIPIYDWVEFTDKSEIPEGDNTIGIFVDVVRGESTEFIPDIAGEKVIQWATWTEGLNNGLKVYYTLNESDGNRANSVDGSINNATLLSTNLFEAIAKIGGGLQSNGAGRLNASGILKGEANITIAYWFKKDNSANANHGWIGATEEWRHNYNNCAQSSTAEIGITINNECHNIAGSDDPAGDGWEHIAVAVDGVTGNRTYFINGVALDNFMGNTFTDLNINLYLMAYGDNEIGTAGTSFHLDEFGLWNRTLTNSEVSDLYNGGTGITFAPIPVIPNITLNLPTDGHEQITRGLTFNCSATSTIENVVNVSLYLDGLINSTTTGNAATLELSQSVNGINTGQHNWTCTSRSQSNYFGETTNNTFTIKDFVENSQTFNASTYETSLEAFVINVSFNSSEFPVSTATLNYNGTGYTGTTSDTGDNKSYSTSLNVPELDISKNISFYWAFVLTNSTGNNYFNSTINNQSSGIINASILNKPYTIPFINFTTYDQDTLTQITSKISNTFGYGISSIIQELSYSDQTDGNSSFEYAFDPSHLDYIIEGDLLFTKANYVDNNYVLLQQTITNDTTNISIYLLNSSRSASFIIQLRDSAFDNVAGAVIESQRFYPSTNTWVAVESFKTNIEGKTIGHFVLEDVNYRFLVYVDTVLVLTSTPTLVFCEETPCTINLQLPSETDSAFANFENLDNYTSNLVYDKTTETFTFSYIDAESGTQGGRLRVVRTSLGVASNVEICDDIDGSGTGILTCDISSETNGTYIASGYSNRTIDEDRLTERIGIAKVRDIVSELGIDGLLWSAILFISIALLFLISPAVGIVGSIFALIGIFLLGLVSIQPLSLFALISVAAILLWVITR